jgi:hypothetical protein
MTTTMRIRELISANVRGERARRGLLQADVAKRMTDMGHHWFPQTCGLVERNQRPLYADELAALALVLDTTPGALCLPPDGVQSVLFGGYAIPAGRLSAVDGSTTWFGNELRVNPRKQRKRG